MTEVTNAVGGASSTNPNLQNYGANYTMPTDYSLVLVRKLKVTGAARFKVQGTGILKII